MGCSVGNDSHSKNDSAESGLFRDSSQDVAEYGRICFEAFAAIANQHNFPLDFPFAEVGAGLMFGVPPLGRWVECVGIVSRKKRLLVMISERDEAT